MFAAVAVNSVALAANATLSFNASCGTKSTSQFTLGSQALTFDRSTIPSWITGLTLHQNIGGMINNTIGLTPATGSWNTSGSSSTCSLDVTVAENTGAARSWTMNILNQSNGSVAWSMLVQQSAGSGGGTPSTYYTVTFNPNSGSVGESTRSVASGSTIGSLPTPSRSGYSFDGWWTAATGGTRIYASTTVSADATYYAHWSQASSADAWKYAISDGKVEIRGWNNSVSPMPSQIDIPSTLEGCPVASIGYKAFSGCEALTRVTIPDSVTSIGGWAFEGCYGLASLTIPNSVTEIGRYAFQFSGLEEVVIPSSVTVLQEGVLQFCSNLTSAVICADVKTIPDWTFRGCSAKLAHVEIPASVENIAVEAFLNCSNLTSVVFNGNAPQIANSTFSGVPSDCCAYVRRESTGWNVAIPGRWNGLNIAYAGPRYTVTFSANGGVVSEPSRIVVEGDALDRLPIPTHSNYAFAGWFTAANGGTQVSSDTIVTADTTLYAHWVLGWRVTFDANGGSVEESLRMVPRGGAAGQLPIPWRNGYSFDGWFTAVNGGMPLNAKTLVGCDVTYYAHWSASPYVWTYTGDASTGLTITGVSPQPSGLVEIPAVLDGVPVVKLDTPIFANNPSYATTVVAPQGIVELGDHVFRPGELIFGDCNIKEIYLPPSIVTMSGAWAVSMYKNCTAHWTVGDEALSMNDFAHANFWGIMDIVALGGVPAGMSKPGLYHMPEIGQEYTSLQAYTYRCKRAYKDEWDAFFAGTGAEFLGYIDDDYEYLDPIFTIEGGVLIAVQLMGGRDVVIPDGVTSIGPNAFAGNTLVRSVMIPASVTAIAPGAFTGCTGLESIAIPYSLDTAIAAGFPSGVVNVGIVFTGDGMTTGGDAEWGIDTTTVHGGMISRRSGAIGNDEESWIEMETQNPGRLSFWWKASSESDGDCVFDYAYLSIDGLPQGTLLTDNEEYQLEGVSIGGKTDWQHIELDITGCGAHTIRWTYCKDEVDEGDIGEDCVWLDDVEFTPLVSVTFDLGDGTGTAPAGFAEMAGTVVTLPDQSGFDLTDYVFEGWSDGTTLYLAGASYSTPYGDVTLTAQWIKKTFLTFDLGGGTGTAPEVVKELRGTIVTLPDQSGFDLADYVFDGWSDGMTTYASGANYTMPSEDVTLTAQWIKKTFLAFDLGGGTGTAPEVVKELRGTVVTLPDQSGFDLTDYVFDGWSDGTDTYSAGASYTMPSEDVTLTAQWIEKRFLTFTIDGGEGTVPVTIKDIPGAVVTLPTAEGFSKPKHTFVGWSDGSTTYGAGDSYTVGDGGVEFTAVWQRNELSVSISSGDVVNGGTNDTQGATISMAAWSDPSGGTPAIYYTLDASVPTTNSTRYVAPFVADGLGEVTVKAIAVMDNYFESDVATFTFTRLPYSAAECIGVPAASVTSGGDMPWFRVLGDPAHDGAAAMRSGAIGDSQSSYVEMTVRGSGSVSFWWRVSSQNKVRTNKHDYLSFTIDGIETATLGGGDIDWTNETCSVADNGMHTLRWTYLKDAADAANEDCAWLDDVAWTPDYNDPLPEIGSSAEVALVLAASTDSRLVAHIATKADYDGFRTWVDEKGLSHKTVMDSRRAWFSYAIGANGLIDRVFGNEDVNIVSIVPMAGGVLTFDAAVAGAPVGAGASPERLASVFAVEGADTLSEEAFSTNSVDVTFAAGLDGRLAVSATPKVSGDAFFMKLKVYPDFDASNDGGTGSIDPVVTSATVTFDANGGSEVAPVVRMIGSELGELPTTAREGHDFGGWFTEPDNGSLVSSSVVVTGDVTYYAHWTEKAGAEGKDALYVDAQAGSDLNTGLSASSAKATIQSAVNAASEGSVIYVAAGTYAPFYTDNKSIRIVGKGGAGVTFVDGGGDYRLANSIHLASGSGGWDNIGNPVQTNTVVEGLTMQNLCTVKGGTIRRCVICNNDCGNVGGAPVNCSVLENCLITGCRGMNGCASDGCLLRNCTITGNSARDMKYVFLDTIAINCIAYNNVQGSYGLDRRWKTAEHRLVSDAEFWTKNVCTKDPFFVDAANGDYRLREGSPCINAGDNGYVFGTKDLNGDTRIVGGCVDIGCYESDL